jgi:hypothetical protein
MDIAEQPDGFQSPGVNLSGQPVIVKAVISSGQEFAKLINALELMDIAQRVVRSRKPKPIRGTMDIVDAMPLARRSR